MSDLHFSKYKTLQKVELDLIFSHYEKTFPWEERREKSDFLALVDNENCNILGIYIEGKLIGYFVIWKLENYCFIEHFEIFENYRSKNFGRLAIQKLIKIESRIILEIELIKDEISNKRYNFYQKQDFIICDVNYKQPSYHKRNEFVAMLLLANFEIENYKNIKTEIYEKVYKQF